MNKTKALELLREFKESYDLNKLEQLEKMLIDSIKLDKVAETTSKTRYKEALKVLKKHNGSKPILEKTIIKDGYQIFTDGYVLFRLLDIIPELPELEDISLYPKTEDILESGRSNPSTITFNCKELKQMININKVVEFKVNDDMIIKVDSKLLLSVLIILNYKNNDMVDIYCSNINVNKPIYFNNNGNEAILMPLRQ